MTDFTYKRKKREEIGVNIPEEGICEVVKGKPVKDWQTKEDRDRIKVLEENELLFEGIHCTEDGGPFLHPYRSKLASNDSEYIPYQTLNLLGDSSKKFADIICGEKLKVTSSDEKNKKFLEQYKWNLKVWDVLTRCAWHGYLGLQAFSRDGKIWWEIIGAENLSLELGDGDEIEIITKSVWFEVVEYTETGKEIKKEYVYQEVHTKGHFQFFLYEVQGSKIVRELDVIEGMRELRGIEIEQAEGETADGDFWIKIVINEKVGSKIYTDYSLPAKRTQEELNNRETSISRILNRCSDPIMIAPKSVAKQDSSTGQWYWTAQGREVLFRKENGEVYEYLTWDGQLTEATSNRDHNIMNLCTALCIAPQLLGFYNLIGSGPAETSSKLKQLLSTTKAKASRKREFLDQALSALIKNLLILNNSDNSDEFSISYPEIVSQMREEILNEMVVRKQNNMVDPLEPWIRLDGMTEEEAQAKYQKTIEASQNETPAPFPMGYGEMPRPLENEEEEEESA